MHSIVWYILNTSDSCGVHLSNEVSIIWDLVSMDQWQYS